MNSKKTSFPKNVYTIYGINNCLNFLLYNKKYKTNNITISKTGQARKNNNLSNVIDLVKKNITYLDNKIFCQKYTHKHTQGIVIEFSGNLYEDLYSLSNFDNNSCFIIADQINDPQNLGQILRTSECSGVNGIVLPKHNSIHLSDTVLQVSQGAFIHINIYIETNLKASIDFFKSKGFWIIGVENSIESNQWYDIDYKGKIAIVIGGEGTGIRKLIKNSCDFLATIDMKGKINSLNVSAAISAILFERQRQLNQTKKI